SPSARSNHGHRRLWRDRYRMDRRAIVTWWATAISAQSPKTRAKHFFAKRSRHMNAILFLTIFAAQDPNATFTVGTATAARGQTAYGQIVVPAGVDSGLKIPVAVINGAKPGKVAAF